MMISEAQQRATNKYNKKAYDQIAIRIPKGKRDLYNDLAKKKNISLASLIVQLLDQELEKEKE